jgi:hypothetical protein
MFEIEKDIPLVGRNKSRKFPLGQMEIGDSFVIPCEADEDIHRARQVASCANQRYKDKKFASRTVDGGIRVWRIK